MVALGAALLVTAAPPAGASVPVRCHPVVPSLGGGLVHTMLLDGSGTVRTAGDNFHGQIGDGSTTNRHSPAAALDLSGVTAVAVGSTAQHSVVLKSDGTVWTWGKNWFGQLGNGQGGLSSYDPIPRRVSGIDDIVAVAAGGDHSLALTDDGTLWAWGANHRGQLGTGSGSDSPVPVQVTGVSDIVTITAGESHSLVVTSSGDVYSWGDNQDGQLGLGYWDFGAHVSPAKVPGLSGITAVAAGSTHSLALRSDGVAYGWGENSFGQTGIGGTGGKVTSPIPVANLTSATALAAGYWHSMALRSDGTAWTWGDGRKGQLGNGWYGSTAWTGSPVQVSGISGVKVIATGGQHSLAVRSDGNVYAWGYNLSGQLGLGSTNDQTTPTQVTAVTQSTPSAPTEVRAVAGENVALVTWEAPEAVVTQYVVTPYRNGVAQPPVGTKLPKLEYAVPDLVDGDTYRFEVKGQNCLGEGTVSEASNPVVPLDVQTDETGFSIEGWELNDRHTARINVSNGNLKITATDLNIAGTGLPLVVTRAYNSRAASTSIFGANWTTTLGADIRLEILTTGSVYFHGPGGSKLGFAKNADGTFTSPAKIDSTMTANADGTYTLRHHFSAERLHFTSTGRLTKQVDRNGHEVAFSYDANGDLTKVTDTQGRDVTLAYDGSGRVTTMNDVSGRQWGYAYDASGRLTDYTDPEGGVTRYHYDPDGRITKVETPGDDSVPPVPRVIEFAYDTAGRAVQLKYPNQAGTPTTTFDYEAKKTVVTDGNGNPTTYHFDAVGRTTKVIDAQGNSVSSSYTSNSNVKRRSIGSSATSYSYSNLHTLTGMTVDTGSGYTLEYGDTAHPYQPTKVTDPQGNDTTFAYDTPGNLVTQTNSLPTENQVDVSYNSSGLPSSVSDVRGKATTYQYDSEGNLVTVTPPAPLGDVDVTYDALSRVVSVDDGKGQVTTYDYDGLDRVEKATFADGSSVEYVYDGDGNVVEMTDATGITTMDYDQRNDLVSRTTPDGVSVSYDYDGIGNLASVTDAGGTVRYSYSAANLLSAVFDPSGQATVFSYDRDFNRTAVRYPNGVSMFSTYDEAKRLEKISAVDDQLTALLSFEYSYEDPATGDDTSLRQSVTDHDGNVTAYTYDALNRLVQAKTTNPAGDMLRDEQYSYDGAGNRKTQTIYDGTRSVHTFYGYNDANQLVNYNGLDTFTYDANGNHTGSALGARFEYNAKDQTLSMRTATGLPAEASYRGIGQAERTSVALLGENITRFTHTLTGMTTETVGGVDRHYIFDDAGQVLTQRSPAGTLYVLTDGLGSTVGLADTSGDLAGTFRYSAFGETVQSTGTAETMPLRYIGAYLDPTGLYKMGERYYDASIGRFTQQDAIHDPLDPRQWNRYLYVGADPMNYADPSGLGFCPLGKNPNGSCRGSGVAERAMCTAGSLLNPLGDFNASGSLAAGAGAEFGHNIIKGTTNFLAKAAPVGAGLRFAAWGTAAPLLVVSALVIGWGIKEAWDDCG